MYEVSKNTKKWKKIGKKWIIELVSIFQCEYVYIESLFLIQIHYNFFPLWP